jgi:prepilin-type N-terminal cleavage/methylation domain-containing protein
MSLHKMARKMRRRAFTLVELMIVVVIVAILAMVAIPLYQGNVMAAQMSEGIAGCGTIRTALRVYAASHGGNYPTLAGVDGSGLGVINVDVNSLDGKYFANADYLVTSNAGGYSVQATHTDGDTYIIDDAGDESGTFTTE